MIISLKVGGGVISGTTFNRTVNDSSVTLCGGTEWDYGASITLSGKDRTDNNGNIIIRAKDNSNVSDFILNPNGTATWGNKNLAMQEDFIPRSGGAVMTKYFLGRSSSTSSFMIGGGTTNLNGANIEVFGSNSTGYFAGAVAITSTISDGTSASIFFEGANLFRPSKNGVITLGNGNYRWGQIYSSNSAISTSDSRLKNSVKDIDNALLDAWETIQPKQYKFNDASEKKGDLARFHTGYIAQDIQNACTDNNLDISKYGLFCYDSWEEEPEISEDVEVEKDGIKTTEKRIVQQKREKGDIYALRYEEALVVECAYLRRENNRLKERLSKIENLLNI